MSEESCPLCDEGGATILFEVPEFVLGRRTFQLLRCPGCGHSYTAPVPSSDELAAYYADVVPRLRAKHDGVISTPEELVTAVEAEKVGLLQELGLHSPVGSVLDIGFGSGGFLIGMLQDKWSCTGVEIGDAGSYKSLWTGLIDAHYGLDTLDALPAESFDLITLWHVLEHLPEPIDVLRRARRLLKASGRLVLAVPNIESLSAHVFQSHWYGIAPPWHLHQFSPRSLHRVFAGAGLTVEHISGFGEQAMYLMWVNSLTTVIERRCDGRFGLPLATALRALRRLMAMVPGVLRTAEMWTGRPGAIVVVGRRNQLLERTQNSVGGTSGTAVG